VSSVFFVFCVPLFKNRSENRWSRIFSAPIGAQRHGNTRCSGVISCWWRYMLCSLPAPWPGARQRILVLCLFPVRGTLPESLK